MSMPSWDFLKSAPQTEALRIESEPPGADAKASSGQECRTPCELTLPAGSELSVTLALNGYQPQTVSVRPEAPGAGSRDANGGFGGVAHLAPNPIYAELTPAGPAPAPKKHVKRKKPVAAVRPATPPPTTTASAPTAAPPPPMPAAPAAESAASATNYPWPTR
jgi:hypothetical protein